MQAVYNKESNLRLLHNATIEKQLSASLISVENVMVFNLFQLREHTMQGNHNNYLSQVFIYYLKITAIKLNYVIRNSV